VSKAKQQATSKAKQSKAKQQEASKQQQGKTGEEQGTAPSRSSILDILFFRRPSLPPNTPLLLYTYIYMYMNVCMSIGRQTDRQTRVKQLAEPAVLQQADVLHERPMICLCCACVCMCLMHKKKTSREAFTFVGGD
jgi:hypothetical protein